MTKKIILTLAVFLILLTVSAVSADDNATDSEIAAKDNMTATFRDLSSEIAGSQDGVINLTRDYRFAGSNDSQITINRTVTINGNNHKIDGASQSGIFTVSAGSLILNDLTLENGNSAQGGAIYSSGKIILNNVVFKNNTAGEGGAIYTSSNFIINGALFEANSAENGGAIYHIEKYDPGSESDDLPVDNNFTISNSVFKDSYNISRGLLYLNAALDISISNSTFANSTSQYGTAIFSPVGSNIKITDCLFENLHSTKSGGVFLLDQTYKLTVENSRFINDSSDAAGGVACGLLGDTGFDLEFDLIIKSSEFKNVKAKFGGAIAQFEGKLTIQDCVFDNNSAVSGAAIYAVCKQTVKNSTFKNNQLTSAGFKGTGGAIYAFSKTLKIENSRFINNTLNAIYCSENQLTVTGSTFENNTNAIETAYDKKRTLKNNVYNTDKLVLNNTLDYYVLIINSTGAPLILAGDEVNVTGLPSRYDSRDYGWVTGVKDQETSSACWIFSTCAALETALLKNTAVEYDLSEQNLEKNLMMYSKYGDSEIVNGGFADVAAEYILSWYGAVSEEYDHFDKYARAAIPIISNSTVHIQDVIWLDRHTNDNYITQYKNAILKYGAIVSGILVEAHDANINPLTSAMYNTKKGDTNHAVCIVGWDDNYPKENFLKTAPANGAWIVKNSYGADKYDNGYIYVSYYDKAIGTDKQPIAYPIENTENYHKNYQTDIGGQIQITSRTGGYKYKNIYTSIEDDVISAVGTYFAKQNEAYTIKIYVQGKLRYTQTGKAPYKGFHTVKLSKTIGIKKGEKFTVLIEKSSIPLLKNSMQHFQKGASYYNYGKGWIDLATKGTTASIKVYTRGYGNLTTFVNPTSVSVECKSKGYVTVTVTDIYANAIKNLNISVKLPTGTVKTLKTNSKGQIKFQVSTSQVKTLSVKITTPAFGDYVKTTSTVKVSVTKIATKLTAKGKTFKVKAKTKKLTVTLKDSSNKAMKKVKVTLRVAGKTYSTKTNAKGKATFKITKLTRKGTFKATVKFAATKYYKASTKKINIKTK